MPEAKVVSSLAQSRWLNIDIQPLLCLHCCHGANSLSCLANIPNWMPSSSRCSSHVSCAALADMTAAGATVMMMMALTMTMMTTAMAMVLIMIAMLEPACQQRMRRIGTPTAAQGPMKARSALLHHALLLHVCLCL